MLLNMKSRHGIDDGPPGLIEMTQADEVVGETASLIEGPGIEPGHKLRLVDQSVLEGDQAEQEVTIGGDSSHRIGLLVTLRG
jgi:hypothetical protein